MLTLEDLRRLAEEYRGEMGRKVAEFPIGPTPFPFNERPAIMGVINLSADSWYRESVCLTAEAAIARGAVLRAQGAAIIDVGAESSLAQAARAGEKEQESKLAPVIRGLRDQGILVSVETYHASVIRAALEAGANLINLTGECDAQIFREIRDHGAGVILCFVQGENVREVGDLDLTGDPVTLMHDFFARRIEAATGHGLTKILVDPGLGFYYRNLGDSALRVRHQMRTFLNSFRLRKLGFPICNALPHAFEWFGEEVRSAESFFAVLAALGGTDLFRTHEVPKVKAVLDTLAAWKS